MEQPIESKLQIQSITYNKCFICFSQFPKYHAQQSDLEYQAEAEEDTLLLKSKSKIAKQLHVIFILRNVLEVPSSQLEKYLKNWGDPENWIDLCDKCSHEVQMVKDIYQELQSVWKKFDKARRKIREIIKNVKESFVNEKTHYEIIDECWGTLCQLEEQRQLSQKVLNGDLTAARLATKQGITQMVKQEVESNTDAGEEIGCSENEDDSFWEDHHEPEESVTTNPLEVNQIAGTFKVLPSYMGTHPVIEYGEYMYQYHAKGKDKILYRCSQRNASVMNKRCKVRLHVSQDLDKILKVIGQHNHLPKARGARRDPDLESLIFDDRNPFLFETTETIGGAGTTDMCTNHDSQTKPESESNSTCSKSEEESKSKFENEITSPKKLRLTNALAKSEMSLSCEDECDDDGADTNDNNDDYHDDASENSDSDDDQSATVQGSNSVKLIPSNLGKHPIVTFGGYFYQHHSKSSNKIFYRCSRRAHSCRVRIHMSRNMKKVLKVMGKHNHPPMIPGSSMSKRFTKQIYGKEEKIKSDENGEGAEEGAKSSSTTSQESLCCPVCKGNRKLNLTRMRSAHKHLDACIKAHSNSKFDLVCKLCRIWSCPREDIKAYFQHLLMCREGITSVDKIPLPNRVIECNLCKEGKYLPYKDFPKHIYLFHLHSYGCTKCPSKFVYPEDCSVAHWKSNHKELMIDTAPSSRFTEIPPSFPEIPWWCPSCFQNFSGESLRDDHLKSCQGTPVERGLLCEVCFKTYYFEDELKLHRVTQHLSLSEKDIPFRCDQCPYYFRTENKLKEHRMREHKADFFSCDLCGTHYINKRNLKIHLRRKHQQNQKDDKDHICEICNRSFLEERELNYHIGKVHDRKYEQTCEKCGKLFLDRKSLQKHLSRTHLMGSSISIRPCPKEGCDKIFSRLETFNAHLAMHEGKPIYFCSHCGKGFYHKNGVKQHERQHNSLIPKQKPPAIFECKSCGKCVTSPRNLRRHQATCKGKKREPLRCSKCPEVFTNWTLFKSHRKNVHGKSKLPKPMEAAHSSTHRHHQDINVDWSGVDDQEKYDVEMPESFRMEQI